MKTIFYKRCGRRVSRAVVRKNRLAYAHAKRTGYLGELPVSIQPTVADRIEQMREEDFADWSGAYTFRKRPLPPVGVGTVLRWK